MVKHFSKEFRGLEDKSHRREKVKKNEMDEVKMKLNIVEMLVQEQENDEDQQWGWKLRKRVMWPVKELYERKLRHRLSAWLKTLEEELMEAKYG